MAGGSIKGITIAFNGDTTKLDKALRQVEKETRSIDKELKQVDKALKFNPTSVELWRQKQQLLTQKVDETKKKLDALKQAQAKMDADGVDKNSKEYRELQREIIATESKVRTFEGQLKKVGNVNLRAASEQFKVMGDKLTTAGQAMKGLSTAAAAVLASMGAITVKSGKWADDMNTMSKKYHIGTGELQKYSAAADLVDVDVNTIAKSHVKLEKSMATSLKGTGKQAAAFDKLGVSVTDADGNLRDSEDVFNDVIAALGNVENETERDTLAMDLMGKSAADLNPLIEDGGEAYKELGETLAKYDLDFIDQQTLDNANAFNDSLDTIKTIGTVAFQQIGTQLASTLAPVMEKVVDLVGRLAQWFTSLSPKTQAIIGTIAGIVAVLAPLLIGLGKVSFAISSIMGLMATLGPAIGGIVATLGPVVLAIGAVIAIGILLYKNWDKIKAKAIELKQKVATAFQNLKTSISTAWDNIKTKAQTTWAAIKTAITTPITNAISSVKEKVSSLKTSLSEAWASIKEKVSTAWSTIKKKITGPFEKAKEKLSSIIETIKGWFPINLGNLFSGIKTPHFKLNTASKEILGKTITYPTGFDVSWYKKGGIFDSPSLIGVGEAGAEAVVPLDKFWDKLDQMQMGQNIVININGAGDPRAVAEEVKRVLIRETNQRRLAWQ